MAFISPLLNKGVILRRTSQLSVAIISAVGIKVRFCAGVWALGVHGLAAFGGLLQCPYIVSCGYWKLVPRVRSR